VTRPRRSTRALTGLLGNAQTPPAMGVQGRSRRSSLSCVEGLGWWNRSLPDPYTHRGGQPRNLSHVVTICTSIGAGVEGL
jgi:hypothetical protein